jgi:hypothetical protein
MISDTGRVPSAKKISAGVVFAVIGLGAFFWSQDYEIGTATRMGPGYFPALLGIVLAGIGTALIIQGFMAKVADPIEPRSLEPLFLVLASVISFGFLVEHVGLVIAVAVSIFLVCFRRALSNPLEVLVMIAALATFCAVVFVHLFEMTIPLFTWRF